jgi:hypothetical protein
VVLAGEGLVPKLTLNTHTRDGIEIVVMFRDGATAIIRLEEPHHDMKAIVDVFTDGKVYVQTRSTSDEHE